MTDKWAVITGAKGGIGRSLVEVFLDNNFSVIAIDIGFQAAARVSQRHVQLNADIEKVALEQSYANELYKQIQYYTCQTPVSALVNNAAVQSLAHARSLSRSLWQQTLNINLSAPFFLTQLLYDDLKATRGSVVNMSSIHAHVTKKQFTAYATSKAALSGLTKSLAVDVGSDFTVCAIEPAAVQTEMLLAGFEGKEDAFKKLNQFHPVGRIASPEEIANLALFLCSNNAAFLHGACISATGGILGCLSDPG